MSSNGNRSTANGFRFPKDFLWGVSTSAHQVEGNNLNNQWAAWERAGRIRSGDHCGLACDWWGNAELDFDLAQSMGFNSLRLSVEWSRIEPQEGVWDVTAIARYRQMLEGLHRRRIRPFISLHHFTNPQWFEERGGFLAQDAVSLFERFTRMVVTKLGDLCSDWVTFNEPNVYVALGYHLGQFPPGKKGNILDGARVTRALCLSHAAAYRAIHELQPRARVGWAQHILMLVPANPASGLDHHMHVLHDWLFNNNFLETIETGKLPFPLNLTGASLSEVKGTCDFVGINFYSRAHVSFDLRFASAFFGRLLIPEHLPQGDCGIDAPYGEAYPPGIVFAVEKLSRLKKPIYILEHGVPDREDRIRPWVITNTISHMQTLIEEGADIRGYFHWTLADNFEWNEGWHLRFGLVHLDPETQERTIRPSGKLLARIIKNRAVDPVDCGIDDLFPQIHVSQQP